MIERFRSLEPREKIFLLVGVFFTVGVIFYFGFYQPYRNSSLRIQRTMTVKERQIEELMKQSVRVMSLRAKLTRVEQSLTDNRVSPLSYIEKTTSSLGIGDKLKYIKPQGSSEEENIRVEHFDIKLERVDQRQIAEFLWSLESSATVISVESLHLRKRYDSDSELDCTLTLSAYRGIP